MELSLGGTRFSKNDIETASVCRSFDGSMARVVLGLGAIFLLTLTAVFFLSWWQGRGFNIGGFILDANGKSQKFQGFALVFLAYHGLTSSYISNRDSYLKITLRSGRKVSSNPCSAECASQAAEWLSNGGTSKASDSELFRRPVDGPVLFRDVLGFSFTEDYLLNRLVKSVVVVLLLLALGSLKNSDWGAGVLNGDFLSDVDLMVIIGLLLSCMYFYPKYMPMQRFSIFVWEGGRLQERLQKRGHHEDVHPAYKSCVEVFNREIEAIQSND